jgi:hypothetical protein
MDEKILLTCGLENSHIWLHLRKQATYLILTFMAKRIAIGDLVHRTVVVSLVGLTVLGIGAGYAIHQDTLKRGRGLWILSPCKFEVLTFYQRCAILMNLEFS